MKQRDTAVQKLGLISLAVVGALSLGACGTIGQPVERTLAEVKERCEDLGGTLTPTGRKTGQPNRDLACSAPARIASPERPYNASRNQAVDATLRKGG